jgi:hypothetical protein
MHSQPPGDISQALPIHREESAQRAAVAQFLDPAPPPFGVSSKPFQDSGHSRTGHRIAWWSRSENTSPRCSCPWPTTPSGCYSRSRSGWWCRCQKPAATRGARKGGRVRNVVPVSPSPRRSLILSFRLPEYSCFRLGRPEASLPSPHLVLGFQPSRNRARRARPMAH